MNTSSLSTLLLCVLGVVAVPSRSTVQEPSAPQIVSSASLKAAIDNLGKLDRTTRMNGSRAIRRVPPSQAVQVLTDAVPTHEDGYVKYRTLVLLTGFDDPAIAGVMRDAITDVNDRLRTVAYGFSSTTRIGR